MDPTSTPIASQTQAQKQAETPAPAVIHLPGKTLEGGGQLVRLALSLSSLTGIPIHITDIRGNRSRGGGLKAQHLTAVQWLAAECKADVEGALLGSRELWFRPHRVIGESAQNGEDDDAEGDGSGEFEDGRRIGAEANNIGRGDDGDEDQEEENGMAITRRNQRTIRIKQSSAGSITLVLQAILPYLLFSSPSSSYSPFATTSTSKSTSHYPNESINVEITGGTNVSHSPSFEYISQVLFPTLLRIGVPGPLSAVLHRRGWSSGGSAGDGSGGDVGEGKAQYNSVGRATFTITPFAPGTFLPAFEIENRGEIVRIEVSMLAPRGGGNGNDPVKRQGKTKGKEKRRDKRKGNNRNIDVDNNDDDDDDESGGGRGEDTRSLLRRLVLDALERSFPDVESHILLDEDSSAGNANSKRLYLLLVAHTSTGHRIAKDWLYDRKIHTPKNANRGGFGSGSGMEEAVMNLVTTVVKGLEQDIRRIHPTSCVDEHLQDQLVVFQALAKGCSIVDPPVSGSSVSSAQIFVPRLNQNNDDDFDEDDDQTEDGKQEDIDDGVPKDNGRQSYDDDEDVDDGKNDPLPQSLNLDKRKRNAKGQTEEREEREVVMTTRPTTLHTQTARWVASEMLGVVFDEKKGSCQGVGFVVGDVYPVPSSHPSQATSSSSFAPLEDSLHELSLT